MTDSRWFYACDAPVCSVRLDPLNTNSKTETIQIEYSFESFIESSPFLSSPSGPLLKQLKEQKPQTWLPFTLLDSQRIEDKYQLLRDKLQPLQSTLPKHCLRDEEFTVPVLLEDNASHEINLKYYLVYPVYWRGSAYRICRASWYCTNTEGKWMPCIDEKVVNALETRYLETQLYWTKLEQEQLHTSNEALSTVTSTASTATNAAAQVASPATPSSWYSFPKSSMTEGTETDLERILPLTESESNPALASLQVALVKSSPNTAWLLDKSRSLLSLVSDSSKLLRQWTGEKFLRGYAAYQCLSASQRAVGVSLLGGTAVEGANDSAGTSTQPPRSRRPSSVDDSIHLVPKFKHLMLLVHGIGQGLVDRYAWLDFVLECNIVRRKMNAAAAKENEVSQLGVLPVNWRRGLIEAPKGQRRAQPVPDESKEPSQSYFAEPVNESEEFSLSQTLSLLSLDGVPALRHITTSLILDLLMFMGPRHARTMLTACHQELERLFRLCHSLGRIDPDECKVSLYGHSLGSVLCFDLVSAKRVNDNAIQVALAEGSLQLKPLLFQVHALFMIGSPCGFFMALRHQRLGREASNDSVTFVEPYCKHLVNIFNAHDVIAFRLEPLIDSALAQTSPALVPYQKGGLTRLHLDMSQQVQSVVGKLSMVTNSVQQVLTRGIALSQPSSPVKGGNVPIEMSERKEDLLLQWNPLYGRIDFQLQDLVFEQPYLKALNAHMNYWQDVDVITFVLTMINSD